MIIKQNDLFLLIGHPDYGRILYQVVKVEGDKVELKVLADRNFGLDIDKMHMINERKNLVVKTTITDLLRDLSENPNEFRKIPDDMKDYYLNLVRND